MIKEQIIVLSRRGFDHVAENYTYYSTLGLLVGEGGNGYAKWNIFWNPVDNDKDSFYLASTMGFCVDFESGEVTYQHPEAGLFVELFVPESVESARYAITFLAARIVNFDSEL